MSRPTPPAYKARNWPAYAQPLPLPTGMTLDAATGTLRFRPESGQEGFYSVTLGVSDTALKDEQTVTIEGNRLASHLSALYASNAHNQLLEDDSYN